MGIGMWELLIILAIVLVIFGAKKLRNLGGDLGGAIKNFKSSMREEGDKPGSEPGKTDTNQKLSGSGERIIDGEVVSKKKNQV